MAFDAEPQWSELPRKRGLDPLGLQVSGVNVYQSLLPGISNITLRMRYYGLFCWLTRKYARQCGDTDRKTWRRWVRRTEALYALASEERGGELGVAGIEWAGKTLKGVGHNDVIDISQGASTEGEGRYLQQGMGIYGAAYATQMLEMGLLGVAQVGHDIWVPTPQLGLPLAEAFAESLGPGAEQIILDVIETARCTRSDLQALAAALPSAIDPQSAEASAYGDLLFGSGEAAGPGWLARRDSLQLILAVADRLGRAPKPDEIRWALFEAPPGDFGEDLEAARLRWEAYHAHDLLQMGYAGLLRAALETLRVEANGLSFRSLVSRVTHAISAALTPVPASWGALQPQEAAASELRAWEHRLSRLPRGAMASESLAASVRLVAALQARIAAREDLALEISRSFPQAGPGVFPRSIRSELAFLDGRGDEPLDAVLSSLVSERVILRHTDVAMLKFARQRDYTFLFEAADGRLKFREAYSPVLTTPRLSPSITFLKDIGLVDAGGLTPAGRARLTAGG
jgi:hypothetical protein